MMREAADQRGTVEPLELVELAAVYDARDHLPHVVRRADVGRHDSVQFGRIVMRRRRVSQHHIRTPVPVQCPHNPPANRQRMGVVLRVMIHHAGGPGMDVRTPKILGADFLAGRRLHQRRSPQENGALASNDDCLVAHCRHIGATRGARSHHRGDLRNAFRRHVRLIEEDTAEMLAIGKDLVLQRQERAAGINQVDAGQAVGSRDLLSAQMLLHGDREICAALYGGIIRHDHAFLARYPANPRDNAGARNVIVVHAVRSELR